MAARHELAQKLYYLPKTTRWTKGIGAALPDEYRKFWKEWKKTPAPVHFIPKEGRFEKREDGTILPVQNVPIPLKYPKEAHEGLWGGEAVIEGFNKRPKVRRVRHYWVPQLKKSVVYSEVLDKYMRMVVTDRTLQQIHQNYGFDHYLLKTEACDLYSLLALGLKRQILISLADKTLYPDDPVKREEVYEKYKKYLENYTREEMEWYGLSYKDACKKFIAIQKSEYKAIPLKVLYRQELIKQLKAEKEEVNEEETESSRSWLSKINPFGGSSSSA